MSFLRTLGSWNAYINQGAVMIKIATPGNAFMVLAIVFMILGFNNTAFIAIGAAFLAIGIGMNARQSKDK